MANCLIMSFIGYLKCLAFTPYYYDIELVTSNNYLDTKVSSPNAYPFLCHGKGYVIQSDGIYRLDGFSPEHDDYTENVMGPSLTKISQNWSIDSMDRVLDVSSL